MGRDHHNRLHQRRLPVVVKRCTRGPIEKSHLQLLRFLGNQIRLSINGDADIMKARQRCWELATRLGFSPSEAALIATITSELARNITDGSHRGEIIFSLLEKGARRGIEVVARQDGPGKAGIESALHEASGTSQGRKLYGVGTLVDEFQIASELGHGTTVTIKKWRQS